MNPVQAATTAATRTAMDDPMTGDADTSLSRACRALWLATLSLMAAFMRNPAPAHRLLLARKIAGNFDLLQRQDCFSAECRQTFSRLSGRWNAKADQLAREQDRPRGGFGLLMPAFKNRW